MAQSMAEAERQPPIKRSAVASMGRPMRRLLAIGAVMLVAGCSSLNPFDAYRDLTGASKNDPPPDAPNTKNLAAGGDQPFPNLASVPQPPTYGLTEAERKALSDSLIADRTNARYSDQQLRAGTTDTAAAPRPPDAGPAKPANAKAPGAKTPGVNAPGTPSPAAQAADTAAAPGPAPASDASSAAPAATADAAQPASREASLTPPAARSEPVPETPTEPPPPPTMAAVPAAVASPPIGQAPAGGEVPSTPPAKVQEAMTPNAAPPVPAVAAVPGAAPPPQPNVGGKGAVTTPITQVNFAPNTSALPPFETAKLQAVPAQLRKLGGLVHVVGYAAPPAGAADSVAAMTSYQAALGRAEAVKTLLVQAGIPANQIQTEAAASAAQPAAAQPVTDRADILIVH